MRWKNFGETTTEEGHKVFFSGKEDKHEHGVGFLVHKQIVNTVMGCHPVSSKLITIRLRAVPFNITIVQAYAPTSDYDNKIEEFYYQRQNVIDQTPKTDFWSLPPLTNLCWRTLFVITKHQEDGTGLAQMDNTTARLITF